MDTDPILQYFRYAHLPIHLQEVSQPFAVLANTMAVQLPRNPERSVALRKLLESKDAAVRAALTCRSFVMPEASQPLPPLIRAATDNVRAAFFNSVPFKRVASVDAALDDLRGIIVRELALRDEATVRDALLAAAQICESRSRTLKSKPAQIEALQCGSAIHTGGRRWLTKMREERNTATPSPGAGVAEHESVGTTTTENG